MISDPRRYELQNIVENEVRLRGFNYGVEYLKKTYHLYDLTDAEAEAVSYLIRNASVQWPDFPYHLI